MNRPPASAYVKSVVFAVDVVRAGAVYHADRVGFTATPQRCCLLWKLHYLGGFFQYLERCWRYIFSVSPRGIRSGAVILVKGAAR